MEKRITTKQNSQVTKSGTTRVTLATSSVVALAGLGSFLVFGFTFLGLAASLGGLLIGLGSYVLHHIKSGAYLPEKSEKGARQKLYRLKFRLDGEYEELIEKTLDWERKIKAKKELLDKTLSDHFSPTELTFDRYKGAGLKALQGIEENISDIVDKFEKIQLLEDQENKKILEDKIPEQLNEIQKLSDAYEKVILSFEEYKVEDDRDHIIQQLEELAKRTKKYLDV